MITHTDAFSVYRNLGQTHLNFVVLTCHAVPALQKELSVPGASPSVAPDHFKVGSNPPNEILGYISNYKEELARSALITVFSYFEAYVKDVLQEIVDFHGGALTIQRKARARAQKFFASASPSVVESRKKLQDRPDPRKQGKYEKYARLLDKAGYRFPTDLFTHFGASQLLLKIGKKQGF